MGVVARHAEAVKRQRGSLGPHCRHHGKGDPCSDAQQEGERVQLLQDATGVVFTAQVAKFGGVEFTGDELEDGTHCPPV